MDEIYSIVIPHARYVIGAYSLLWVALMVYVGLTMRRVGRLEKQLGALEESVGRRASA